MLGCGTCYDQHEKDQKKKKKKKKKTPIITQIKTSEYIVPFRKILNNV